DFLQRRIGLGSGKVSAENPVGGRRIIERKKGGKPPGVHRFSAPLETCERLVEQPVCPGRDVLFHDAGLVGVNDHRATLVVKVEITGFANFGTGKIFQEIPAQQVETAGKDRHQIMLLVENRRGQNDCRVSWVVGGNVGTGNVRFARGKGFLVVVAERDIPAATPLPERTLGDDPAVYGEEKNGVVEQVQERIPVVKKA